MVEGRGIARRGAVRVRRAITVRGQSAFPPAASQLGAERGQGRFPESAESSQPGVHLGQRIGFQGIEAPSALRANAGEPGLAQHPQMLRDRWLRNAELALHDPADVTGGRLAGGEQLDDPATDRISENVERVHETMFARTLI